MSTIRNKKRRQIAIDAAESRRAAVSNIRMVPVPGFENLYLAGDDGFIYNARTFHRLHGGIGNGGYLGTTLCDGLYRRRQASIHTFVCSAFHGDADGREVNHKNGIKTDNRPCNLEWVSRRDNLLHAADHDLKPTGERSHLAKLTEAKVYQIRALLAAGELSQPAIARKFSVTQATISRIKLRRKWRQLP